MTSCSVPSDRDFEETEAFHLQGEAINTPSMGVSEDKPSTSTPSARAPSTRAPSTRAPSTRAPSTSNQIKVKGETISADDEGWRRTPDSSPPLPHDSDASDHGFHRSSSNQSIREDSQTSSVTSNVSQLGPSRKIKRAKRHWCQIPKPQEDALVDWVREHGCLWDSKRSDYRMKTMKDRLWEEKSEELGISVAHLTTWFRSLRDIFTKQDKGKWGNGGVLTERAIWIKTAFAFLRKTVRHRPQSAVKNAKAMIAGKNGDLSVAEMALAEQGQNVDDDEDLDNAKIMPKAGMLKGKCRVKRSASAFREEEALRVLQQRIAESVATLDAMKSATLQPATLQPVTSRTAFANYVRDSLLSMSDQNFKRARKEMNRFLSSVMDEDDDDDSGEALSFMQPYVR